MASAAFDGGKAWDFLVAFFAARRSFLAVFARYEARVHRFAREAGVHRDDLVIPPASLARLFHARRLQYLRDVRFAALRSHAHGLFRESGIVEPLDTVASHCYHEISILLEEHLSVVRFQHLSDPRRYEQMFEEVSGYYPARLRRVRKLLADGVRRVEEILPEWARDRVFVRSAYLFGERLARGVWEGEGGLDGLYAHAYPGGAPEGYLEAARSFVASGFQPEGRRALEQAVAIARRPRRARSRRASGCIAEARRMLKALPQPKPVPA